MRSRPTSRKYTQGLGFPVSLALHLAIIASFLFTWSQKIEVGEAAPVVPVELVTLADKTNIAPQAVEVPKPAEESVQTETEQPKPQPVEEVAPDTKPIPKPVPPKPKPKDQFDIDKISALLDKKTPAKPVQQPGRTGTRNIKGIGDQNAMTADLAALLNSQIKRCWSAPVGAPHPETYVVEFRLILRRDGSIAQTPQVVSTALPMSDPFMRATKEAAFRAIYTCAPYRLPAERYAQWQDVTFTFTPDVK